MPVPPLATALGDAAAQAWPPFVLVGALLVLGVVAHAEGLFAFAAALLERLPGPTLVLYLAGLALVAAVTAVLNLDTAVVFLTPVLVGAARRRAVAEEPFLYGTVLMANASSLVLPGANLTNLLVLAREDPGGGEYVRRILAPALAAMLVTALGLVWPR